MRSAQILFAGVLLLGCVAILGRLFTPNYPGLPNLACWGFITAWLALTGFNMWVGVAKAGYSVSDELPVFLVLFLLPAAVALVFRGRIF